VRMNSTERALNALNTTVKSETSPECLPLGKAVRKGLSQSKYDQRKFGLEPDQLAAAAKKQLGRHEFVLEKLGPQRNTNASFSTRRQACRPIVAD